LALESLNRKRVLDLRELQMTFDVIPFPAKSIDRGKKTFDDFIIDRLLANGGTSI